MGDSMGKRLSPLDQKDPEAKREKAQVGSVNSSQKPHTPGPALVKAWREAMNVTEAEKRQFIPTELTIQVGEAILSGATSPAEMAAAAGVSEGRIRGVLSDPVGMAWVSQQIYELYRHRTGIVDAALYARASAGDIAAIKLFYERMGQLNQDKTVHHVVSGGIDISGLEIEDLRRIVADDAHLIPAEYRLLEGAPAAGEEVSRPEGAQAPDSGGADALLPPDAGKSQEAAAISRQGEDPPPAAVPGRKPKRENNGRKA